MTCKISGTVCLLRGGAQKVVPSPQKNIKERSSGKKGEKDSTNTWITTQKNARKLYLELFELVSSSSCKRNTLYRPDGGTIMLFASIPRLWFGALCSRLLMRRQQRATLEVTWYCWCSDSVSQNCSLPMQTVPPTPKCSFPKKQKRRKLKNRSCLRLVQIAKRRYCWQASFALQTQELHLKEG